jgi:hypothetical protein
MRALVLGLLLLAARPAEAWCLLLWCGTNYSQAEAPERLAYLLGPLPEGVKVERMLEGGFQDVFVQARLSVDEGALPGLMAWANLTEADFGPDDYPFLGPETPSWYDYGNLDGLVVAEGQVGWRYVTLAVAPDPEAPGRWRAYLFSFVT